MARALRHDTDHAQAFNRALLLEGVDDLLRAIAKVIAFVVLKVFSREISIRKRDRKISVSDQAQDTRNNFCLFTIDLLSDIVDDTRRTLIEARINLVEQILVHIGELCAQAIPTAGMLHGVLIQPEDRVEFISGEIVVLHDNTFQVMGGLPLRICPLPFRTNYITRIR